MRTTLSLKLRFEIMRRDHFRCRYCGAGPDIAVLEIDHVEPVAEGGDDSPENLLTACRECNAGKGARTPWEAGPPLRPAEDENSPAYWFRRESDGVYTRIQIPFDQPALRLLWQTQRCFSYAEAAIDLAFRSHHLLTRSEGDLARAWNWDVGEVRQFIQFVTENGILYRIPPCRGLNG